MLARVPNIERKDYRCLSSWMSAAFSQYLPKLCCWKHFSQEHFYNEFSSWSPTQHGSLRYRNTLKYNKMFLIPLDLVRWDAERGKILTVSLSFPCFDMLCTSTRLSRWMRIACESFTSQRLKMPLPIFKCNFFCCCYSFVPVFIFKSLEMNLVCWLIFWASSVKLFLMTLWIQTT